MVRGRPSGDKTRCSGLWTEAKFRNFIKNNLRAATRKWEPIQRCRKDAHVARGLYECALCKEHVPPTIYDEDKKKRVKNIAVDHVEAAVDPETGFTNWDDVIEGLFCEVENLQLLCKACHDKKCAEEIVISSKRRGYYKTHLREYTTYVSMKGRCSNPKIACYKYYGGKGVKVCDRWLESFDNFYEDMGPRPEGTTLDRKDSDGDYCKDNCRWSTWEEQGANKSSSIHIEYEGQIDTISGWARTLGMHHTTLGYRIRNNFTVPEALGFDPKPSKATLLERREAFQEEIEEKLSEE